MILKVKINFNFFLFPILCVIVIFSIYLGKYKEVQWLNHIVRICCFIRNCQSVFQSSSVSFILISKEWESLLLTSSSAYNVVSVLDFCHSNRCVVVSHCCFNLQFLMTCSVEYLFIRFLAILISSEMRYIFKLIAHF